MHYNYIFRIKTNCIKRWSVNFFAIFHELKLLFDYKL